MNRLSLLFPLAFAAPSTMACELPGGPAQTLRSPGHTIVYRAAPRVGEHFSIELAVCPPPEAVRVDASMPAHRHGMNYRPSVVPLGGGRYRAQGLMFHMPGEWQLLFEVQAAGTTERITHDLRVE